MQAFIYSIRCRELIKDAPFLELVSTTGGDFITRQGMFDYDKYVVQILTEDGREDYFHTSILKVSDRRYRAIEGRLLDGATLNGMNVTSWLFGDGK